MPDSSTGGFLPPLPTTPPTFGDALEDQLQITIKGVTGLPGPLVRPMGQAEPPNLPARPVTWASFRVIVDSSDTFPVVQHDGAGDGKDVLIRHERMEWVTTFMGPEAQAAAAMLRDGLAIAQNREALQVAGMALSSVGEIRAVPVQIKEQWVKGYDVPVFINREVRREYAVLNLLSAGGEIRTEDTTTEFSA